MKHALALAVALLVAGCGGQSNPLNICNEQAEAEIQARKEVAA